MPAVKAEQKMTRLIPNAFERVSVSLREIPDITNLELICLGFAICRDYRRPHLAFENIGPFGGDGVPMQFAKAAGFRRIETPAMLWESGNSATAASLAEPAGPVQPFPSFSMSNMKSSNSSIGVAGWFNAAVAEETNPPKFRPVAATPTAANGAPTNSWRRLRPVSFSPRSDEVEEHESERFIESSDRR
jgi:hypothetical protein